MNRSWLSAIVAAAFSIAIVVGLLIFGAGGAGLIWFAASKEPSQVAPPSFEYVLSAHGSLEKKGDTAIYRFNKVEVAENVLLQRTIEYEQVGPEVMGAIVLEFENNGTGTRRYSHVETIPKSFAEDVDNLEFSEKPDRIIEADPKVGYMLTVINETVTRFVIKAKEAAVDKGAEGGIGAGFTSLVEQAGNALGGKGFNAGMIVDDAAGGGAEAGGDAAQEVLLDNLGDFIYIADMDNCDRQFDSDILYGEVCLLALTVRYPDRYKIEDCDKMYEPDGTYKDIYYACRQLISNNPDECGQFRGKTGYFQNEPVDDYATCRSYVYAAHENECLLLPLDKIDDCIYGLCKRMEYPDGCARLSDDELKRRCTDELGGRKEDATTTTAPKTTKTSHVAPTTTVQSTKEDEVAACKNVEPRLRNQCLSNTAKSRNDSRICSSIPDDESRGACYHNLGIQTRDGAVCALIKQQWSRWDCIAQVARLTGDYGLCDQITNENTNEVCKVDVAERLEDDGKCGTFKDEFNRNDCYYKVAAKGMDGSVCAKISAEPGRDTCYDRVAKNTGDCSKIRDNTLKTYCEQRHR